MSTATVGRVRGAIAIGAIAIAVLGLASGCTVDRRPPPDSCEPAIGCSMGYLCDPATHRCLEQLYMVTVARDGSGSGRVTSTPTGIDCGPTTTACSASFMGASNVTLTAMPDPGSTFWQFRGDCSGPTCSLTMDSVKNVTATFLGGAVLWARRFGGSDVDVGYSLAVAGASSVVVVGSFTLMADFGGPSNLSSLGVEDAFAAAYASSDGAWTWATRWGGMQTDVAQGVALDATAQQLSVVGYYQGTSNFGGAGTTSAGLLDIFLGRYAAADGSHVWDREFGGPRTDAGSGVAVDPRNGDVVMTGFGITVDYGDGVGRGDPLSFDTYVAKYAATDGAFQWVRTFGGLGMFIDDRGFGVAIDAGGDALVVGQFMGTVDFGDGRMVTSSGAGDIFVVKLAGTNGNLLWARTFGTSGTDSGWAIALDGAGNAFITGNYSSTLTMDSWLLTDAGFSDAFVAELLGTNGAVVWAQRLGGMDDDSGYGIAVTPTGDAIVTGFFRDSIDLGSSLPTLTAAGSGTNPDVFVARLAGADGHGLWLERFGGPGSDFGRGVAVDSSGTIFVTGDFEQTAAFGSRNLTSAGLNDGFLVSLAP